MSIIQRTALAAKTVAQDDRVVLIQNLVDKKEIKEKVLKAVKEYQAAKS